MKLETTLVGYSNHKDYEAAMRQVEAKASDMLSDLALVGEIKFAAVKEWIVSVMRPGQTFDEALDAAHFYNTLSAFRETQTAKQ